MAIHNECNTVIPAARSASGQPFERMLREAGAAGGAFAKAAAAKFGKKGEW